MPESKPFTGTMTACFRAGGWTSLPHEANRFGGFGRDTSAGYAEVSTLP